MTRNMTITPFMFMEAIASWTVIKLAPMRPPRREVAVLYEVHTAHMESTASKDSLGSRRNWAMLTGMDLEGRAGSESARVEATTWQREPTVIRLSRLAAVTRKRHVGVIVVAK